MEGVETKKDEKNFDSMAEPYKRMMSAWLKDSRTDESLLEKHKILQKEVQRLEDKYGGWRGCTRYKMFHVIGFSGQFDCEYFDFPEEDSIVEFLKRNINGKEEKENEMVVAK